LGEGKGLKLALVTSTPDAHAAISSVARERCLEVSRRWAPSACSGAGDWAARPIAQKSADGGNTLAMEAVAELCGAMPSARLRHPARGRDRKLTTRAGWRIIDDTVQIAGAATRRPIRCARAARRRYRSSASCRLPINLIFEGSSEIMHLFIAPKRWTNISRSPATSSCLEKRCRSAWPVWSLAGFYGCVSVAVAGWSLWPRYAEFGGSRNTCASSSAAAAVWRAASSIR